jgi:hypothetical protein
VEPTDTTLIGAAVPELAEDAGVDPNAVVPVSQMPACIEYGRVPARPQKGEPEHLDLDLGYAFTTVNGDIGCVQESEVTSTVWYPLDMAERLVGSRIARVSSPLTRTGLVPPLRDTEAFTVSLYGPNQNRFVDH